MSIWLQVSRDLDRLPAELKEGGIAATVLMCARALDEGGLAPRDAVQLVREIRLSLAYLREIAPGESKGDKTDELRERREQRLAGVQPRRPG